MKKIFILITLLFLTFSQVANSQISFSANEEYGQIYDVIFDPIVEGTIYARTVGNHILKSEDNATSWDILYSDPMDKHCTLSNLKLLNNGQNLSFIVKAEGTDYNKVIVIKNTDGTIEKVYNVPNPQESDVLIASYDIYEADNDTSIIHTTYTENFGFKNEVFRTIDGGASWQSIYYSGDNREVAINNIAISPDNPNKIFLMRGVSTGSDIGGLFISEDGGVNWEEKIPGNTYSAIEFNPNDPNDILLGTFYGYGTHTENLYRSLDGGDTWNIVPITYNSMSNNNINYIKFNPQNTDNILVLEENEIIISNDNGITWHNEVFTEIDPENYYFGLTASFNPFETNELIISANFYPFRSTDGGYTLEKLTNKFVNSTGRIDSYFKGGENHLYYGLRNGFIHRNVDSNIENGYRMRPLNNTFGSTTFPYSDKEVAGRIFNSSRAGMNSYLEMSTDHGENYETILTSMMFLNIYTLATDPNNTSLIWFSFGENIFTIDVSDSTSPIINEISMPNTDLSYGIIIDPDDSQQVLITKGVNTYKTIDGGSNWEETSNGLEALIPGQDMILDASVNPLNSEEYLLATTKGIYLSSDKGDTWNQIFDEFVEKVYFSDKTSGQIVALNYYSDGFLYPESSSRIIYSTDNGLNWEIISSEALEYLNANSSTIQFFEESANIYFGTFDLGLVEYTIDLSVLGNQNNQIKSQDIIIFPNPTTHTFTVESVEQKIKDIAVYTSTGKQVLKSTNSIDKIDVSNLTHGLYLVKITTNNGAYFKRLLKK
ncbi:T9SS type A sorting domain-containing protein [Aequorivita sp. KMM 9714]|uniref:T9SS type A sorting domain-containing protein n=1 Tax=Aequorivita sp. KMM 9714 TaxID=2707173 RepID=UPI0013ED2BEF|nr:T9SS type A sorting domain-containing protein [Aequorivita sp. KMM 9714]NGX83452.1 T9SS type A sorting domain-containing protein [Aequorivita sp. KMM 9714]